MVKTAIAGVVTALGLFTGVFVFEDRYEKAANHESDMLSMAQQTTNMFMDYQINQYRAELNALYEKDKAGRATPYDLRQIEHLQKELDRLYQQKAKGGK